VHIKLLLLVRHTSSPQRQQATETAEGLCSPCKRWISSITADNWPTAEQSMFPAGLAHILLLFSTGSEEGQALLLHITVYSHPQLFKALTSHSLSSAYLFRIKDIFKGQIYLHSGLIWSVCLSVFQLGVLSIIAIMQNIMSLWPYCTLIDMSIWVKQNCRRCYERLKNKDMTKRQNL